MAEMDFANGEDITLEKPQRGSKDGYLQAFFNASQQMNRIIAESNGIADFRFRLYTLKMIAGITDDKIRKEMFDFFEQELNNILNMKDDEGRPLSTDERNQKIADFCCGEMQGHIVAWYDQFMGITHRLSLGTV